MITIPELVLSVLVVILFTMLIACIKRIKSVESKLSSEARNIGNLDRRIDYKVSLSDFKSLKLALEKFEENIKRNYDNLEESHRKTINRTVDEVNELIWRFEKLTDHLDVEVKVKKQPSKIVKVIDKSKSPDK